MSILSFFCSIVFAIDSSSLSLSEYLQKVSEQNRQVQISRTRISAAEANKSQALIPLAVMGRAGVDISDQKETGVLSFQAAGDRSQTQDISAGVSKEWITGTNTSIEHRLQRLDLEGIPSPAGAFWMNTLELRLKQDLWKNIFGARTRAEVSAAQQRLEAAIHREKFTIQLTMVEAEAAYWNYALARELSQSVEASLKRNEEILSWNRKRQKLGVVDRGDVLQSEAKVMELKRDLESTKTRETEALRLLHFYLGEEMASDVLVPKVDDLSLPLENISIPPDWDTESREDLKALNLLAKAQKEQAFVVRNGLSPDLELTAAYAGRSADISFSNAESQTFDNSFRRYEIGLNLEIPLNFGRVKEVRAGAQYEADAQSLEYEQARYQIKKEFLDLRNQLRETIENIKLAIQLQKTQSAKLKNEDDRFRQGRSSSFQLLTFEEDLARADVDLARLYAQARNLAARLRLYGGMADER